MFSEVGFGYAPRGFADQLKDLEAQLGRAIRVLSGSGRAYTDKPWTREMLRHCSDFTPEQCRDEGVTIVSYSSMNQTRFHGTPRYEGGDGLFGAEDTYETDGQVLYDMLRMPDDPTDWLADPITLPSGFVIGEVAERTVLWHLPWLNYGHGLSFDLTCKGPIEKSIDADFLAGYIERRANATRDAFVRYAQRVSNEGLDRLRREVGSLMTQYDRALGQAATAKVELRAKQRMLDVLMSDEDEVSEAKILETWGKLLDDPRIEEVRFDSSNRVVIDTVGLDLTHPRTGVTVYLGKMRWIIAADGSDICEVHNLDNARGGFDHPHVHMNHPCFGELGSTIYTLIKQGKLYPAVELIFAFLSSINLEDDWARRAAFWFEDPMDSPRREPELTDDENAVVDEILDELAAA